MGINGTAEAVAQVPYPSPPPPRPPPRHRQNQPTKLSQRCLKPCQSTFPPARFERCAPSNQRWPCSPAARPSQFHEYEIICKSPRRADWFGLVETGYYSKLNVTQDTIDFSVGLVEKEWSEVTLRTRDDRQPSPLSTCMLISLVWWPFPQH